MFGRSKSTGLDIADNSIEVISVISKKKGFKIFGKNRIIMEDGIVTHGRIKNKEKLKEYVIEVFNKAKPHGLKPEDVIFGLPESQVYYQLITVHSYEKGDNVLFDKVKANFPIAQKDIVYISKIIKANTEFKQYMVFVASREVLYEWKNFFNELGIKIDTFDIEPLALFRGLYLSRPDKPVCLVDIGAKTTNISFFSKKGMIFAFESTNAGESITGDISKALKMKRDDAEKLKIKDGISNSKSKAFLIILKSLEKIKKDINEALVYFNEKTGSNAEEIVFVGGTSGMKGIGKYFKEDFKINARIGTPVLMTEQVPVEYIGAIGLAVRNINEDWKLIDPSFPYEFELDKKEVKSEKSKETLIIETNKDEPEIIDAERIEQGMEVTEDEQKKKIKKMIENEEKYGNSGEGRRNARRFYILLIILIIEFILLGAAFWYNMYSRQKQEDFLAGRTNVFNIQKVQAKVSVTLDETNKNDSNIFGRIYNDNIINTGDYNQSIINSYTKVNGLIQSDELVLKEPLEVGVGTSDSAGDNSTENGIPINVSWLILSKTDSRRVFSQKLSEIRTELNLDYYVLESIDYVDVVKGADDNTYEIIGLMTVLVR